MNQEEIMQQLQIGMQALQTGDLDAAENIFSCILSVNSSEVHSLHFLGVVFCQKGNLDDGIALIEQSICLDPSRFGPYLNMGRFLVGANQWDRAVSVLQEAVERDANSFDAWSMLAQSSFFAGNADAALSAGKKAAGINPGSAEIFFSLGVYASETNKDEAIDHYRNAVSIDSASFKAWVNLGNCLLDCQRVEDSIAAFNEALKSDPSCFQALMGLCRAYGDLAKWSEALDMAKQALSLDPSSHDAAFWVGSSLHKLGRIQDAVNAYREALNIFPVAAYTHLYLASALEGLSEQQDALRHYELATNVDPKLSLAFTYWGALLQKCGDSKLAIDKCRRAVEADPLSADALVGLGTLLHESGEVEEAIASYRKAIEVKPDFADAYLALGLVMKEEGGVEEAIASYRKAIEAKPDFADALSQLASELVKRDESDEAISLYKRALVADPEHANSSAGLGWCFLRSDQLEGAIEYYSNQLISSPSNIDALFFLFEAMKGGLRKKLKQDFSYAANFLKKCLELMCVSRIVTFGDSHVQLFEGCNEIDVNHVGASTAYNLAEENSSTGGRRQVLSRVARMNPMTEAVLLCFGEVDVRANVIKYCYQKGLSIEECVDGVVDRYMSFAGEIALRGFKVLIYGGYGAGGDRNSFGSERERNYAAKRLNASLSLKCKENGFIYFSLHDALLDEECLETDSSFLSDGFHLYNDESTARGQVQALLFERACQSAQALFEKRKNQSSRHVVLGNVGVSKLLRVGSLESGCLSWDAESDPLESVVFDLGACIRFESINLELESDLDADRMNLILDGRLVEVNISRESSCRWYLRPLDQAVPFIGRYPMLKASSDFLLSIKGFSVKELSLV